MFVLDLLAWAGLADALGAGIRGLEELEGHEGERQPAMRARRMSDKIAARKPRPPQASAPELTQRDGARSASPSAPSWKVGVADVDGYKSYS